MTKVPEDWGTPRSGVSLDTIRTFVAGKTVLLIGNAANVKPCDADITIRMNTGIKAGPCDIWIANMGERSWVQRDLWRQSSCKYILRLNAGRGGQKLAWGFPPEMQQQAFIWNSEEWEQMAKELRIMKPLSGTIAVYWLLKYTTPKMIYLTGMDFFQTGNVHTGKPMKPVHVPQKDRQWTLAQPKVKLL